mgnify:CR=1 FL=1
MKKVGIMSMQRIVNYGSFLQAYALKKTIESFNNEVVFIDYNFEQSIVKSNQKFIFLTKVKNNLNFIAYVNKKMISKKFRKKYNLEYLKILGINNLKYNYDKAIDTLVIGSDEVFNCLQPYPVGYSRELFGKGYEDINLISYAASFGHVTIEQLKHYKIDKEIGNMLKKFHKISVRDYNSYSIVKEISSIESIINFDPVLIGDFEKEISENPINIKLEHYIVLYAYTGRLNKEEEKYIKKFAKKNRLKIISLGFYQKIADKNIIVNPFEVLNFFKNADYVITDTFHGTIFSVKMNTNFCTLVRKNNYNKLYFLLKELKQEERMVNNIDDIELLYHKKVNFKKSNDIIEKKTKESIQYLKKYV